MKSNQISVILVHTAPFLVEYKSINNDIDTFQKEINCNFFDVKSFTINDKNIAFTTMNQDCTLKKQFLH